MKEKLKKLFAVGTTQYLLIRLAGVFILSITLMYLLTPKLEKKPTFTVVKVSNPTIVVIDNKIDEGIYHSKPAVQYKLSQDSVEFDVISFSELRIGEQVDLSGKNEDSQETIIALYFTKGMLVIFIWLIIEVFNS